MSPLQTIDVWRSAEPPEQACRVGNYTGGPIAQQLLMRAEAPVHGDAVYSCVLGGLDIHLGVSDVDAALRHSAQLAHGGPDGVGRGFALDYSGPVAYSGIHEAGEVVKVTRARRS